MSVSVPEEAMAGARQVALSVAREAWEKLRGAPPADAASADFERAVVATVAAKAVEAAAPLIVAVELERLADEYWSSSHLHRVCKARAADLRVRASVLRGEGQTQ